MSELISGKEALMRTKRLICGVGVNDLSRISKNGVKIWEYVLWKNMLNRAYCEKFKEKNKGYSESTCCDDWLILSKFIHDINLIQASDRYEKDGWNMDKDIMLKGNKVYSPALVCFVPKELNSLILNSRKTRGDLPLGVHMDNFGRFVSSIRIHNRKINLGIFNDIESAFMKYKSVKEFEIKSKAEKWKSEIHKNVYNSLMAYTVDITD